MTRSVVILTPRFTSYQRFGGEALSTNFRVMTRSGYPSSLPNLDALFNSSLDRQRLGRGLMAANPMAGYYLASFLRQHGYDTRTVFRWEDDTELSRALETDPVALLFSTTLITNPTLLARCLGSLNRLVGSLPIVVGGPFVYKQQVVLRRDADPKRVADLGRFGVDERTDLLFRPEPDPELTVPIYVASPHGEHTLLEVLSHLEHGGEDLTAVPNLVLYGSDGRWVATERRPEPFEFDSDRTHWDLIDESPKVVPIRTTLGCPHRCRYCDFHMLHPRVMVRGVPSIVEEIREARDRGCAFVNFVDDNVFLSKKRVDELTRAIIDAELDIVWGGFFRADQIDESNIEQIHQSGCRFGICGIESGDDGQLERMNRKWNEQRMRRGVDLATAAGVEIDLTFVAGFPGETAESIANTAAFLNRLKTDGRGYASFEVYPFYLTPNTAADDPRFRGQHGLRGRHYDWTHDTMGFDELTDRWIPELFKAVNSVPYDYNTSDSLPWYDPGKRNRAFSLRRELTVAFLDGAGDEEIQQRFLALHELMAEPERSSGTPHWSDLLAARGEQPGGAGDSGAREGGSP